MNDDSVITVLEFIEQNVESLAQLEALLLLHRDRMRMWTADELAKALYLAQEMAIALLQDLARRGFASEASAVYQYRTKDASSDLTIDQLAQAYQERRVAVITKIYSKPLNKVQTFADAFRLRKGE
jgi:hypothetical protein